MKNMAKYLLCFLIIFFLFGCYSHSDNFKKEFKTHVNDCNEILFDGDELHPTYAFLKNGKIKGIELNQNPECGKVVSRYYADKNEHIYKIIVERDFYSDHCGIPFDSIYVFETKNRKIKVYTKSNGGKEIMNDLFIEKYQIDINNYKKEIKNWHSR
jgi:hypothetical protein